MFYNNEPSWKKRATNIARWTVIQSGLQLALLASVTQNDTLIRAAVAMNVVSAVVLIEAFFKWINR